MKSKIIKALFTGELSNQMIDMPKTQEYKEIEEREFSIYNKLRSILSADALKLFDEFIELYGERYAMDEENYYIGGFKLGLRLAIECFDLTDISNNAV